MTELSTVQVFGPDERPARRDGTCFYCAQPVGGMHTAECVIVQKMVRVRVTLEIPLEVPARWSAEDAAFHYNQGGYCGDNFVAELSALVEVCQQADDLPCLCEVVRFEFHPEDFDTKARHRPIVRERNFARTGPEHAVLREVMARCSLPEE